MRIALDYDVYAADAGLWDTYIDDAKGRGHEVICMAKRDVDDRIAVSVSPAMLVYYIGSEKKKDYVKREGIKVDVWIDAAPSY